MCSLSGLQIILHSHFRHYYTEFLSNCCLPNLRKLCESNIFVQISCNVKGLVFDFYLHRKRNKRWLTACSCDLFTYQSAYISVVMLRNLSHDFARYIINTVGLEDIGCR